MVVTINDQSGDYGITTGKRATSIPADYETHGIIKNLESDVEQNPGAVELIFHSGMTPDTMPDLTVKKNITITDNSGQDYAVKNVQAVRPSGVTMLYKAVGLRT